MLSSSVTQPQVLAAISQFSSLLNGIRVASTEKGIGKRQRHTSHAGKKPKAIQKSQQKTICELDKIKDTLTNLGLENLPKDITVEELCPLTSRNTNDRKFAENYISSATFFENKHGFPENGLHNFSGDVQGRRLKGSLLSPPAQCIYYQIQRQFHTRRRKEVDEAEIPDKLEKSLDKFAKKFFTNLQNPHSSIPPTQKSSQKMYTSSDLENFVKLGILKDQTKKLPKDEEEPTVKKISRIVSWFVLITVLWLFIQRKISIDAISFSEVSQDMVNEKFSDVKGIDEAKEELMDVVKFLQEPQLFTKLGAKVPKGILLEGPPGVGKTLLARATAGEAGVPFYYAAGSEFEEMFVGLGAKRVRDLFKTAKRNAPCIIFIDEIDSIAPKRSNAPGQHPSAHQVINQLLAELDGFKPNDGVFVMAATNRKDVLDPAILRPGRLDVLISVELPDQKGREELFSHYLKKIHYDSSVDEKKLARGTIGMTGADISNVVNQAALKAAKDGSAAVDMSHIDYAKDKILMGAEKNTRTPDEETNWITACHEAGHTIVGILTKDAMPVYKVTIMKRGNALGHTQLLPEREMYGKTKSELLAHLDVCMGGRVAEEIMFGADKVTTGASSDFQAATDVAKDIVLQYGMSEKVGVRVYSEEDRSSMSAQEKAIVDEEVNRLLQESYTRTKTLLTNSKGVLTRLAKSLMKYETLSREEVVLIMDGKTLNRV